MAVTLWVALGGALGSVARYWLGIWMLPISKHIPFGTIIINVVGSFAIAFFMVLSAKNGRQPASEIMRAFFMVGLCGGFTTFSSFSLQTVGLLNEGFILRAFLNVFLSVLCCLGATAIGLYSAHSLNQ